MGFVRQVSTLSRKQALLALRNWKQTVVQILVPVLICLIMFGFQSMSDIVLQAPVANPELSTPGRVPTCIQAEGNPCFSILYSPNVTWVENLMKRLARRNGLSFSQSFKLYTGSSNPSSFITTYQNLSSYIADKPNQTQHAIIFQAGFNALYQTDMPVDPGYTLFYNSTAPGTGYTRELVIALNEAIFEYKVGLNRSQVDDINNDFGVQFSTQFRDFPSQSRITVYDVIAQQGGTWFFLPPMITFFLVLTEIVTEKEKRLRIGMRMMGLDNGPYWTVWYLTGLCLVLLSSLVLIIAGLCFQFSFFLNGFFFSVLLMFLFFGSAMVALAMLLSVFIQKSETAQTVGYGFVLAAFVFQIVLTSGSGSFLPLMWQKDIVQWVVALRWILTMYPPFDFAKIFGDIASKSTPVNNPLLGKIEFPVGFKWDDMWEGRVIVYNSTNLKPIEMPSMGETLGWLTFLTVAYMILLWYFDNVLPGEHGSPKKPYFPFVSLFKLGRKIFYLFFKKKEAEKKTYDLEDQNNVETDPDLIEERKKALDSSQDYPLRILGISKQYDPPGCGAGKGLLAVNKVSLVAEKDQILCLLGHNGAGKTTLVNMLTGLFQPSGGTAVIYGFDINEQIDDVHEILGVCPQHDILWPELSAREHLMLFCKLKGFTERNAVKQVNEILAYIKLSHVADNPVSSFSGGMKRRLSIGISTIGSPKIIFMDEPTTGLDPVNRRAVWKMIQKLKQDRVIILTTHSMEEADVLSDKVAIMAYGKLKCVGSGLHLKNRFGKGYRFNLVVSNKNKVEKGKGKNKEAKPIDLNLFIQKITKKFPELSLEENNAGNLQFSVPLKHKEKVPAILNYLEENKENQINEWGLGHATLEEVFLYVAKQNDFGFEEHKEPEALDEPQDDKKKGDTKEDDVNIDVEDDDYVKNHKSHQYRALFRKNFALQSRQTCTNVCQILTPAIVILIMLILQLVAEGQTGSTDTSFLFQGLPVALNDPFASDDLLLLQFGGESPVKFADRRGWMVPGECFKSFWVSDVPGISSTVGGSSGVGNGTWPPREPLDPSVILSHVPYYKCNDTFGAPMAAVPAFTYKTSDLNLRTDLYSVLLDLNSRDIGGIQRSTPRNFMPDGYMQLFESLPVQGRLNVTLGLNTIRTLAYHRKNNFTRAGYTIKGIPDSILQTQGWVQMIDIALRTWMNYALTSTQLGTPLYSLPSSYANITTPNATRIPFLNVTLPAGVFFPPPNSSNIANSLLSARFLLPMPYITTFSPSGQLEAFGSFLYPIAMSLQLAVYIYILVLEKRNKLREIMKSHGLRTRDYYFVNYVFFFFFYVISVLVFWGIGALIKFRLFSQTHPSTLFVFFLGWGFALVSLAFFVSAFLSDPRAATITGYVLALVGSLVCINIAVVIYGSSTFSAPEKVLFLPAGAYIWPQMSFVRGIYLMGLACNTRCYGPIESIQPSDELTGPLAGMYIAGLIYWILFLYFDAVLPTEYGVPKHPLFFLMPLIKFVKAKMGKEEVEVVKDDAQGEVPVEDEDVAKMREIVNGSEKINFRESPLVIKNLRKVYDSGKVAVNNLCLMIKKNSIFGMLGENGAGKTTTISMLTGLFGPTSGTAYVGGFDITTDMDNVHLVIGLCPQFDVLWEDLTCKEHLLFYARLKGISPAHEKEHVRSLLKQVGLYPTRNRPSAKLSGGMKRRLSLAISLCGSSRVTFLDEPTTGLDPATRRHIWSVVAQAKKDRAIILTTHGMDEAETLCSDIAILAHGKLRCVGAPQHLKNKHGEGYLLTVAFSEVKMADKVTKFVMRMVPQASCIQKYQKTHGYRIPPNAVAISQVFLAMEEESHKVGISDWNITQLGLDSIFRAVVAKSNAEKNLNVEESELGEDAPEDGKVEETSLEMTGLSEDAQFWDDTKDKQLWDYMCNSPPEKTDWTAIASKLGTTEELCLLRSTVLYSSRHKMAKQLTKSKLTERKLAAAKKTAPPPNTKKSLSEETVSENETKDDKEDKSEEKKEKEDKKEESEESEGSEGSEATEKSEKDIELKEKKSKTTEDSEEDEEDEEESSSKGSSGDVDGADA